MAEFTQLYSGKGLSAPLPSDGGRATSRLSDFIVQAEEIKYKAFKENEQEFLKNSNIDPVFLVSTKNRDAQMDMLNAFNQKWAQKFKESGYNLSTEDKKALLTEKNFLLANQQDMQAKQDLWLQHRNMIMQDQGRTLDMDEWSKFDEVYRRTGEYPLVAPPVRAKDFAGYLRTKSQGIKNQAYLNQIPSKYGYFEEEVWNVAPGKEEAEIDSAVMDADPAATKGLLRDWEKVDVTEKQKIIQEADTLGKNPISLWASRNPAYKEAIVTKDKTGRRIPTVSGGGANANLPTLEDFGKVTTKYKPQEASSTRIGQTDYTLFHTYDNVPVGDIPMGTTIRLLNPQGETVENAENVITSNLVGYDEIKDEFVFIATKDYKGLYSPVATMKRGQGHRFAVKRADLPPKFSNLKVSQGGKFISIKDIKRTTPAETGEIDIGI